MEKVRVTGVRRDWCLGFEVWIMQQVGHFLANLFSSFQFLPVGGDSRGSQAFSWLQAGTCRHIGVWAARQHSPEELPQLNAKGQLSSIPLKIWSSQIKLFIPRSWVFICDFRESHVFNYSRFHSFSFCHCEITLRIYSQKVATIWVWRQILNPH